MARASPTVKPVNFFEQKADRLINELGFDRFVAAYLALGARNGVEHLRAEGAFDDADAPRLNRGMRNALYEAWVALREGVDEQRANTEWFQGYCWEQLEHLDELEASDDSMRDVLAGACMRAASQFMLDSGAEAQVAEQFAAAATEHMLEYYELMNRVMHASAAGTDHGQFAMAVGMLPDYWEPAELSSEFQAQLDAASGLRETRTRCRRRT
jgi:hypothetical protein